MAVFFSKNVCTCTIGIMVSGKECGRPPLQENRIVGGADAAEGAWPWQVDVQVGPSENLFCKIIFP